MDIVFTPQNIIMGYGTSIARVNAQGEENLIQVNVDTNGNFYYIGTNDRDTYTITPNVTLPSDIATKAYTFDGTTFTAAPTASGTSTSST